MGCIPLAAESVGIELHTAGYTPPGTSEPGKSVLKLRGILLCLPLKMTKNYETLCFSNRLAALLRIGEHRVFKLITLSKISCVGASREF